MQTEPIHDSPLRIYSADHGFCKSCPAKGEHNLLWQIITSNEQSRTKLWLQVDLWATEEWNFQLICLLTSCSTLYACVHSVFCRMFHVGDCALLFVSDWNSYLWALMLEHGTSFMFLNEPFLWMSLFYAIIYFWPTSWISSIKTIIIPLALRGHETFGLEQHYYLNILYYVLYIFAISIPFPKGPKGTKMYIRTKINNKNNNVLTLWS